MIYELHIYRCLPTLLERFETTTLCISENTGNTAAGCSESWNGFRSGSRYLLWEVMNAAARAKTHGTKRPKTATAPRVWGFWPINPLGWFLDGFRGLLILEPCQLRKPVKEPF
jgi:hypothetical protein